MGEPVHEQAFSGYKTYEIARERAEDMVMMEEEVTGCKYKINYDKYEP